MKRIIALYLHSMVSICAAVLPFSIHGERFSDRYKPLNLDYLYNLVDSHPEMKNELDEMFRIKEKHNLKKRDQKKIIAYSLFWKSPHLSRPSPTVNKKTIYKPHYDKSESFYDKYLQPLLHQVATAKKRFPDLISRIYLAQDLDFLAEKFIDLDAEVFIMAHNSLAAAPGCMWRFLAFDDPTVIAVYCRDADAEDKRLDGNFAHTDRVLKFINSRESKGFFRIGDPRGGIRADNPIMAGCFGGKKVDWINMEKALKGFIIHRKLFTDEPRHPKDKATYDHPYGIGNVFPNYGIDERFLKHVLYFAAADRGQLTLISTASKKQRKKRIRKDTEGYMDLEYTKFKTLDGY